jgi:hypothetical protein
MPGYLSRGRLSFLRGGFVRGLSAGANSGAVTFEDGFPVAAGHTLVVPREHVTRIEDLDHASWAEVFRLDHEVVVRLSGTDRLASRLPRRCATSPCEPAASRTGSSRPPLRRQPDTDQHPAVVCVGQERDRDLDRDRHDSPQAGTPTSACGATRSGDP